MPGERRLDNPRQVLEFLDWYAKIAKERRLSPNPYSPQQYYDLERFYKAGMEPQPGPHGHFSSQFKAWNSPERWVNDLGMLLDSLRGTHPPIPQQRGY